MKKDRYFISQVWYNIAQEIYQWFATTVTS